jgi:hypothetical protein
MIRIAHEGQYWVVYSKDQAVMSFTTLDKACEFVDGLPEVPAAEPFPYARAIRDAKAWLGKSYLLHAPVNRKICG